MTIVCLGFRVSGLGCTVCAHAHMHRRLSSAGVLALSSGGLHGVHVGGGRPCRRPIYDLFRSELPQRKLKPVCCMALGDTLRLLLLGFGFFSTRSQGGYSRHEPRVCFIAASFWSRGHASVEGACSWGLPDETGCLLSYRQLTSHTTSFPHGASRSSP